MLLVGAGVWWRSTVVGTVGVRAPKHLDLAALMVSGLYSVWPWVGEVSGVGAVVHVMAETIGIDPNLSGHSVVALLERHPLHIRNTHSTLPSRMRHIVSYAPLWL